MRLSKANNDGSVSVRIPKRVAQALGWNVGDEVHFNIAPNGMDLILHRISYAPEEPKENAAIYNMDKSQGSPNVSMNFACKYEGL